MPVRILIADDHAVVRSGLRALLGIDPEIVIVGEAGDGTETLHLAETLRPDLVLLDITMPPANGIETAKARTPGIQMITVTGSTAVGIQIAKLAAENLKKVHMELGGNDAMIILGDSDLEKAAESVVLGRLARGNGQICCAVKRIFVETSIYDQFADLLLALRVPLEVRRLIFGAVIRLMVGDLTAFGMAKPDHRFYADASGGEPVAALRRGARPRGAQAGHRALRRGVGGLRRRIERRDRHGGVRTESQIDRDRMCSVLSQCHGNKTLAARHLGISRVTLWKRLKALGRE